MSRILRDDITKMWGEAEGATRPRVASNGDLTFHINHPDCPAGEDTRRRLYLTEEASTGTILAYCHNCGLSGVSKSTSDVTHVNRELGLAPVRGAKTPTSIITEEQWLEDILLKAREWSPAVVDYVEQFIPLPVMAGHARCVRSYQYAYPLHLNDAEGTFVGIQVRNLDTVKYKYQTFLIEDYYDLVPHPPRWMAGMSISNMENLIIVEDFISAVKLWDVNQCDVEAAVYALLGSHITNSEILNLSKKFKRVCIWLDNDNTAVLCEVTRMRELFACLGVEVYVFNRIPHPNDPKIYQVEYINEYLKSIGFA